jgi:hypothetical protein
MTRQPNQVTCEFFFGLSQWKGMEAKKKLAQPEGVLPMLRNGFQPWVSAAAAGV